MPTQVRILMLGNQKKQRKYPMAGLLNGLILTVASQPRNCTLPVESGLLTQTVGDRRNTLNNLNLPGHTTPRISNRFFPDYERTCTFYEIIEKASCISNFARKCMSNYITGSFVPGLQLKCFYQGCAGVGVWGVKPSFLPKLSVIL